MQISIRVMSLFIFALALSILFTGLCRAATIYVPDPISNIQTIQDGIDIAGPGDAIFVKDGTYKGARNTNLDFKGKAVTLQSENGPAKCIIDGEGVNRGFHFHSGEGSGSVVSGFTVTNCKSTEGGGIFCESKSSPTITNCTISKNSATYGAAIYCLYSSPTITNCTITGNSATDRGGGLYGIQSSPTIANCTITQNSSDEGGGIDCGTSSPSISNCTISGNTASYAGGIFCGYSSSPAIINCTISGNVATRFGGGGIYCHNYSSPSITNCAITGNSAFSEGGGIYLTSVSSPTITNCTISGNSAYTSGGGVYCESYSSPKITNSILWGDTRGGNIDEIYVFDSYSSPTVAYSDIQGGWTGLGSDNINQDPLFVSPSTGDYHLQSTSPCINKGTNLGAPVYDLEGVPRPQAYAYDMGAYEYVYPIYVPDQYGAIQAAIDDAVHKGMVVVRDGVYTGDGNTNLDFKGKAITLKSENGPAKCIIDGEKDLGKENRGVYFHSGEGPGSILSGFTIRNCKGSQGGGIWCLNSSPTITNCMIMGNSASYDGGGIHCWSSSATIINCTIADNSAYHYGGGGIHCLSSSPTITNCTITGNSGLATYGGGISCFNSFPSVTNSILWGNTGGEVSLWDSASIPVMTYSDVQGGYTGKGNIDSDPFFVSPSTGDYRLQSTSPCIDKGTSSGAPTTDMLGTKRPQGAGYDMGAYEYKAAAPPRKPGLPFLPLLLDE